MSGDASRCLSSVLGIDLSGQFVPRVAKTLMRSSAAKFWGLEVSAREKVFSDHFSALSHADPPQTPSVTDEHAQYQLIKNKNKKSLKIKSSSRWLSQRLQFNV